MCQALAVDLAGLARNHPSLRASWDNEMYLLFNVINSSVYGCDVGHGIKAREWLSSILILRSHQRPCALSQGSYKYWHTCIAEI